MPEILIPEILYPKQTEIETAHREGLGEKTVFKEQEAAKLREELESELSEQVPPSEDSVNLYQMAPIT